MLPRPIYLGQPVNWAHPLNRGLVAWFLAGVPHATGGLWYDLCAETYNTSGVFTRGGTLTNMDPEADWVGSRARPGGWGALDFDGSNDYVLLGTASRDYFTDATGMTFACWIKTTTTSRSCPTGAYDGTSDGGWTIDLNRGAATPDAGKIYVFLRSGSTATDLEGYTTADCSPAFNDGAWHHIICTAYCTTQTITVFVDGVNQPITYVQQTVAATIPSMDGSAYVGALNDQGSPGLYLAGMLDDVRFYRRNLSAAEAKLLYDASRAGYPRVLNRVRTPLVYGEGSALGVASGKRGLHTIKHGFVPSLHPVEAGAV